MADSLQKGRICVIGAGPSGLCFLYNFSKISKLKKDIPTIVCYEKQDDYGGLWNFSWRTGVDQYGEPCHGGMYHHLWSNGPKECLEFPDYTYQDHFKHPIPSFPPRAVLRDYLMGRMDTEEVKRFIKLGTVVRRVTYDKENDEFIVSVKDLKKDMDLEQERFSHVIVASGHFSYPHVPSFEGIESFPGRVLHAHDFRDAREFAGKRLVVIGASYSAEDLALQCIKFGAKKVICTWRTKAMNFHWPEGIEERPLLTNIDGKTVHFKDKSVAEVDAIILCTGYRYHFPFLEDDLRLKTSLSMYPDNLYKGTIFTNGGNNKLLYLGMQDQYYTFTMFDVQAEWACSCIMGDIELPSKNKMLEDVAHWREKNSLLKDCFDDIKFQTEFVGDLTKELKRQENHLDVAEMLDQWEHDKLDAINIADYRDKTFKSKFTGHLGTQPKVPWIQNFDDSLEGFVISQN